MVTTLAQALPHCEFTEYHDRVIQAPPERVWAALEATRWDELTATRPLMAVRTLGRVRRIARESGTLLRSGPVPLVYADPPHYAAGAALGQPWRLSPPPGPEVKSLEDLRSCAAPGWLKYGMDFTLHPLPGHRTRLATSTLCEATDAEARRRFTLYWRLIRPFSGLIRRDMLRAVARRAHQGP